MGNGNSNNSNNSFSHAFLPGLILGLIIGAVAGTLLPEVFSGSKLPANRGLIQGDGSRQMDHQRDPRDSETEAETQQAIDDALNEVQDQANDATDAVEDIIDDASDAIDDMTLPTIPGSDD